MRCTLVSPSMFPVNSSAGVAFAEHLCFFLAWNDSTAFKACAGTRCVQIWTRQLLNNFFLGPGESDRKARSPRHRLRGKSAAKWSCHNEAGQAREAYHACKGRKTTDGRTLALDESRPE